MHEHEVLAACGATPCGSMDVQGVHVMLPVAGEAVAKELTGQGVQVAGPLSCQELSGCCAKVCPTGPW